MSLLNRSAEKCTDTLGEVTFWETWFLVQHSYLFKKLFQNWLPCKVTISLLLIDIVIGISIIQQKILNLEKFELKYFKYWQIQKHQQI